jgi:hypothetical protein
MFMRLQASGFEDLHGADVSATVPISERLLNEIIQESLPRSVPIRDLHVTPQAGDRFVVRTRIGSSPLIPALKLTVLIAEQPRLPSSSILVLKLEGRALVSLAGAALRFLEAPAGVHFERDHIAIDIATLLEQRGFRQYLEFLRQLEVHTTDGVVVVTMRGGLPAGGRR